MKKIMLLLFIALLVDCKPIQQIQGTSIDHTGTNINHSDKHDSIYIHQKGDTIFYTRFKTLYQDRWHTKTDSIHITDTLKIKTSIYNTVEKKLTWLQSVEIWIGRIILIAGILIGLFFGAKYLLKLRRIIP